MGKRFIYEEFWQERRYLCRMSWLRAVLLCKCPRCRQGKLFSHGMYDLKSFDKMHPNCPVCGQQTDLEPGFYYGAMFLSYGLGVVTALPSYLFYYLVLDMSMVASLITLAIVHLLLTPYIFRVSRALWLSLFVKYSPLAKD